MDTPGSGEPKPFLIGGVDEGPENLQQLVPQLCVILPTSATFAWQLEIPGLSAYKSIAISHLTT